MAIDIEPTPARRVVVSEESFTTNALWGDRVEIDATKRDYGMIGVTVTATPYLRDVDGNTIAFAADSVALKTGNLIAACDRVPEMVVALEAVQAGIAAWYRYSRECAAKLMEAQSTLQTIIDTEKKAINAVQADVDAATAARNAAFSTRKGPTDPAWLEADATWIMVRERYAEANHPTEIRIQAEETVKRAQAAFNDPANPPL